MNTLLSLFKKCPNIVSLMVLLIGANIVAWLWAFTVLSNSTSLLVLSLIVWHYGLHHTVDTDHTTAINSAMRKLMQQKRRALTTGARFSLGHSITVVLTSAGITLTTSVFKQHMAWFQNVGGLIGATVSAVFLLILATINLIIFYQVWKASRHLKRIGTCDSATENITVLGPLNWPFRSTFRLVGRDWHMYFVGSLSGLGFNTATEISLLRTPVSSVSNSMSAWSILVFPTLLTCDTVLIDCLDSILVVGAYGWAFSKPQRRLYYNMTITGTPVIVALFIGGLEAPGFLSDASPLQGGLRDIVSNLSDHMENVGFTIIGVFIDCWIISAVNYRWEEYDGLTFG